MEVEYDPAVVSYGDLLTTYWAIHDPTTPNRQGPDVGTQYRSAIFFHDEAQEKAARESLAREQAQLPRPIVTEVVRAGPFFRAEDYHQQYEEKRHAGLLRFR